MNVPVRQATPRGAASRWYLWLALLALVLTIALFLIRVPALAPRQPEWAVGMLSVALMFLLLYQRRFSGNARSEHDPMVH